jgi:hypothetical protein
MPKLTVISFVIWSQLLIGEELNRWRRWTLPGSAPLNLRSTQRKRMGNLIMEDDIEVGAAHVQLAVVVNEAQFAELI